MQAELIIGAERPFEVPPHPQLAAQALYPQAALERSVITQVGAVV
jgi:hypothetical protein